ncbi:unnamed protein product [Triticum turgidum subsp. durum]|uniref:Dynamin GTPase n=1 Tax=Triticum turgidum subsp. durum TaxID=4567 RepID=A0A9R1NV89_TRITD|nr:unnamed protein product [Triticum turgidum subsp. durum]
MKQSNDLVSAYTKNFEDLMAEVQEENPELGELWMQQETMEQNDNTEEQSPPEQEKLTEEGKQAMFISTTVGHQLDIPSPTVIVHINGKRVVTLLDSRSIASFMSQDFAVKCSYQLLPIKPRVIVVTGGCRLISSAVAPNRVATNLKKIQAIVEWPAPDNVTKLRSFLGLAGTTMVLFLCKKSSRIGTKLCENFLYNKREFLEPRTTGGGHLGGHNPPWRPPPSAPSSHVSQLKKHIGSKSIPSPWYCPIKVLQLVRHSAPEEWGEFLHAPGRRFDDFEHIKREIQSETDKEAGGNKGVSDKQIRLKIFSPNVIDITLVDLPGITRVPVGDQPSDIESRIRTMIMQYIKHPSCIILAVSPANADLANSDALQLARLGDPDGSRTIGVITKLDIMDRGTDARNFLLGNVIPLKLGYVGIVNRSQEDINFNRSIKDALAFEEKFFSTLPAYHGLSQCCGVPQLAKKLNMILLKHITDMLPGLKSRINAQLVAVAKEHAAYGDTAESTAGQGVKLLNILGKYCEAFSSMVEGKNKVSTDQLSGGARIHYIFQSIFVKSLEVPFEILVRKQIGRLLDPSLQCAKFIYDELVKISHGCLTSELQKYPILKRRMGESVSNFLRDGLRPAETMITHIIEMEMDYINTSHSSFIGGSKVVELAKHEGLSSRGPTSLSVHKDGVGISSEAQLKSSTENNVQLKSERGQKSRAVFARDTSRGAIAEKMCYNMILTILPNFIFCLVFLLTRDFSLIQMQISTESMFGSQAREILVFPSEIGHLPPSTLKPSENKTDRDRTEIAIVKLLVKSYYDIVRKSIEDAVPKAIMHFLITFYLEESLYNDDLVCRESLLDDMLRETDEVLIRRQRIQETLQVLEQAHRTLEEFPLEAEKVERGYSLSEYGTGLPNIPGLSNRNPRGILP